ncbi:hypothetical protein J8M20_19795 [Pseudoalteromonas luteoviolacea]|uniref:hypothetical protein n=1 Tax=Pseudoalteromonas luteoviolacea TaxID=43657 RepID=UPI001B3620E2|nr:hypothetical protein [Pseudoalteromonas luteoviolacea]MBQ4813616.1 hypothetical protein [Pseudoalteromonas luteoviolacea]
MYNIMFRIALMLLLIGSFTSFATQFQTGSTLERTNNKAAFASKVESLVKVEKMVNALNYEFTLSIDGVSLQKVNATLIEGVPGTITFYDDFNTPTYRVRLNSKFDNTRQISAASSVSHAVQQYVGGVWTELAFPELTYREGVLGKMNMVSEEMRELAIEGKIQLTTVSQAAKDGAMKVDCDNTASAFSDGNIDISYVSPSECCGGRCGTGGYYRCCGVTQCCTCSRCCTTMR